MYSLAADQPVAMVEQDGHQPPAVPFTATQAHRVMQFHIVCRAKRCPRKAAVLAALVAAGRLVLAENQPR
ncbi:hypothetical protein [Nocardia wallacei]|uniref:hypothetical protein n=1 Tax=Nocardia wallacei TaxID=480035 RepID=UPI002455EA41|nr:hypothetical protein [Nocardia wallacei]